MNANAIAPASREARRLRAGNAPLGNDNDELGIQRVLAEQLIRRPEVLLRDLQDGHRNGLQRGVSLTEQGPCRIGAEFGRRHDRIVEILKFAPPDIARQRLGRFLAGHEGMLLSGVVFDDIAKFGVLADRREEIPRRLQPE